MIPTRDNQLLRQCLGDNGNIELEKAEGTIIGFYSNFMEPTVEGKVKKRMHVSI